MNVENIRLAIVSPAALAAASLVVLAGCASYGPYRVQAGQTAEQVQQAMGPPTSRYPLANGRTQLEYARGPMGKHTYMVDLDGTGHVERWRQVLTEQRFNEVIPGLPQNDLLLSLGQPSQRRGGGRQGGEVWSYRYDATFCQWFQVSVIDGRVHDSAYAPDPLCDDDHHLF